MQLNLDVHDEIIIDNFAGGGGASTGIELAIGLRMLAPRELYRAQGFPEDYIIDYGITPTGQRIPLTKTAQVRMCGNSVCPPLAAALVSANLPEMAITLRAA